MDANADGNADTGEIDNILSFQIRMAHGAVYRNFSESFEHLDLTQKQVSLLWLVNDHPGIAQVDLAHRLRMDRATVMAIVNRLENRKFLVRGPSPSDGRKQTLDLLPDGITALAKAKKAMQAHEGWLKQRFTDKEIVRLIEMLARIHD